MPEQPDTPEEEALHARLEEVLKAADEQEAERAAEVARKLDEMESRLAASREERQDSESLFDREFEDRLSKFNQQVDGIKAARDAKKAHQDRLQAADSQASRGLSVGLSAAYTIIGMPLVGAAIGWLADRYLGTHNMVGIGVTVLGGVGVVLAIVMLNRHSK
jgi:F0F1-type ATP synthase assembly protein I